MRILNAGPEFSVPMTEHELRDFLSNNDKLNLHLGTLDEKGHPSIHPTWYFFDPSKDRMYVNTSRHSKKTYNLSKNQIVYFCIDKPTIHYKGVRGKGQVRIHEDTSHNIPIAEKKMVKYLGSLDHPMAVSIMETVRNGTSIVLEINPRYYSTWDDSKIKW